MILKMNISATFVVAYIQANPLIVIILLVLVFVLFVVGGQSVSEWVTGCHFRILTQRVTFET